MRIMHLVDDLPPAGGGLEQAADTLARHWASEGHQVVIITGWRDGQRKEEEREGVHIVRVTSSLWRLPGGAPAGDTLSFPPVPDAKLAAEVQAVIRDHLTEVVHSHSWLGAAAAGAIADIPTVYSHHDAGYVCARKDLVRQRSTCEGPSPARCLVCAAGRYGPGRGTAAALAVRSIRYHTGRRAAPHAHVAVSRTLAGQLAVAGIDSEVIPTPVRDSLPAEARDAARPEWVPEGRYLIQVGQVSRHKGADTTLQAHRLLREAGVGIPLLLVGPVMDDMAEEAAAAAAEGPVRMLGRRPHHETLGAIRHAEALLAPSVQEPYGRVALEALAAGTFPIVSRGTGLAELVEHQVNGLQVPPEDPAALAAATMRVLQEPDLARRVRKDGPAHVSGLTVSRTAPKVMGLYMRLTGAEGREGGRR